MQPYSLEGYRTMRGMRLMLINLWPFTGALVCSWVPRRWEKTDRCCRKRVALAPFWNNSCKLEHFFRGTLCNYTEQIAPWKCGSQNFIYRCWSHYTPISCYRDIFMSARMRRTSVKGLISRHMGCYSMSVWHWSHSEKSTHYKAIFRGAVLDL